MKKTKIEYGTWYLVLAHITAARQRTLGCRLCVDVLASVAHKCSKEGHLTIKIVYVSACVVMVRWNTC